jgi:hypothetical protein
VTNVAVCRTFSPCRANFVTSLYGPAQYTPAAADDKDVILASAFAAGQFIGVLILVAIVVGVARTFLRKDIGWREKVSGGKPKHHDDTGR